MAAEPPAEPAEPARPELEDAPPFSTWPRLYLGILAVLAVQVILYAVLTAAFR